MNLAVIQARLGSSRLPEKVLLKLGNKTVIEHVVRRVKKSKLLDRVVVATTTSPKDDKLVEFLASKNIEYYRGSENDVLSRYYDTASLYSADAIVRVTSDCPLIDYSIIDTMLESYLEKNLDLFTNTGELNNERTFPRGLDVEIFSKKILEEAFFEGKKKYQREHVTPYMYENCMKKDFYFNKTDLSNYRLTLDTKKDYEVLSTIFEENNEDITLTELLKYLKKNESILDINKNVKQKELEIES